MFWNDLNEENIRRVKELYYDYLEENKDTKYSNNLKGFEEFIEDDLTRCDKCKEIYNRNNLKIATGSLFNRVCYECHESIFNTEDEWQDNYEEEKLKEEGWL